jgi:hypothetical protein
MANDIHKQLLDLLETLSDVKKMVKIRAKIETLDMTAPTTYEFKNMIITLNTVLDNFSN